MPIDLLILAFIAGFILYRLYMTLGEESGFDETDAYEAEQARAATAKSTAQTKTRQQNIEEIAGPIRPIIQQITKIDPEFSLKEFREGATWAFEMIIEAYAKGDLDVLKRLTSQKLFKDFSKAIREREEEGLTFENTLVRIESDEVIEATLKGTIANLKVKFVSEQIPLFKDKNGEVVEGNIHQIDQVIENWTFERDLNSDNPNWALISTEA